jgi:hypothetical protein
MNLAQAIVKYGMQDAEPIEASIILSAVTVRPIPVLDLIYWLSDERTGLLERDAITGQLNGPLADLVIDAQTPVELAQGIRRLINHLYRVGSKEIDTTEPAYAVEFRQMALALQMMQLLTADQIESLYLLGGGQLLGDVPADDVQVAQVAIGLQQEREAVYSQCAARLNAMRAALTAAYDLGDTPNQIKAAFNASWSEVT